VGFAQDALDAGKLILQIFCREYFLMVWPVEIVDEGAAGDFDFDRLREGKIEAAIGKI
jgi:hypothetical protein